MNRRGFFVMLISALGVTALLPAAQRPVPKPLMRDRYNDPPDDTLRQQIFS